MRYFAGAPADLAKAAQFVKRIAAVEEEFGYRLDVGHAASGVPGRDFEAVTFGPDECFALLRSSDDDDLPGGLLLMMLGGEE